MFVDFLLAETKINAERFCETLKKLRTIENWRIGMLNKGTSILQDNARLHVACETFDLL